MRDARCVSLIPRTTLHSDSEQYCIVYIQHTYLVACMSVCCDTAHVQQSMAYALSGPTHVQLGNTHVQYGQYGHIQLTIVGIGEGARRRGVEGRREF